MDVVLAFVPIVVIAAVLVAAFVRRKIPVPWGAWRPLHLFGFVILLMLIGVGLSMLSVRLEQDALRITLALLGVLMFPVALYVLMTGAQRRPGEQSA
jgi:hypothetical protein